MTSPGLRDLINARARDSVQRAACTRALSHPACGSGAGAARGTLLLAENNGVGSLWSIEPGDGLAAGGRPFVNTAEASLELAAQVAEHRLPLLATPPERESFYGLLVANDGGRVPDMLDGDSFGLSMVLDHWARCLGTPVLPNVAASAAVGPQGRLVRVGGLRAKILALHRWALNVDLLLVAEGDEDEARTLIREHGVRLRVQGLAYVEEAWPLAFPPLDEALTGRWSADPVARDEACRDFFELAVLGTGSKLRAAALARAAAILLALPTLGDRERWMASVAHAISSRHDGEPLRIAHDSPFAEELPADTRVCLQAQILQSWTDTAEPGCERILAEIPRSFPSRRPEELALLGARARLFGAVGRWDQAIGDARAASDAWMARRTPEKASHPVCEWVRIAGLLGDAAELTAAEAMARRVLAVPGPGRPFLWFELGRAWALMGEPAKALRWLGDHVGHWAAAAPHVRASRLRWLVRVDVLDGRRWRSELDELVAREPSVGEYLLLVRLDEGDEEALAELEARATEGRLIARLRRVHPDAGARRLGELFPY